MDAYLVLLVHTMDDLPIGLFGTYQQAARKGRSLLGMPTDAIRELYNTDCSSPVCVKIVEFNLGVPVRVLLVKEFD